MSHYYSFLMCGLFYYCWDKNNNFINNCLNYTTNSQMKTNIENTMKMDVYKAIWLFLHFIVNIIEYTINAVHHIKLKFVAIWNKKHKHDLKLNKKRLELAQNDLDKIPIHLAIVLANEEPNFQILSNVVYWCLSVGIQHVSFYDHKGMRKHQQHTLNINRNLPIFLFLFFRIFDKKQLQII